MSPSNKAYNDVKAILGKLDRSIDDARKRRLDTGPRAAAVPAVSPTSITTTPATLLGAASTTPTAAAPQTRQASIFGRAQPLRPTGN